MPASPVFIDAYGTLAAWMASSSLHATPPFAASAATASASSATPITPSASSQSIIGRFIPTPDKMSIVCAPNRGGGVRIAGALPL
jgi:hypothetical protein